jgi:hypothetical protein
MIDCLDVDDIEASQIRLQHILTPEEQRLMRDFNADCEKKRHAVYVSFALDLISEEERDERLKVISESKIKALEGEESL